MLSLLQESFGRRSSRRQASYRSSSIVAVEVLDSKLVLSAVVAAAGDPVVANAGSVDQASTESDVFAESVDGLYDEASEHTYPVESEAAYSGMMVAESPAVMLMNDISSATNFVSLEELEVMHELFSDNAVIQDTLLAVEQSNEASDLPVANAQQQTSGLQQRTQFYVADSVSDTDTDRQGDEQEANDSLIEDVLPEITVESETTERSIDPDQADIEAATELLPVEDAATTDQSDNVKSTDAVETVFRGDVDAELIDQLFLPGDLAEILQIQSAAMRFEFVA